MDVTKRRDFSGYAIDSTDGLVGDVRDFYFDDAAWILRYFVVDTGTWLASRKVLVSPIGMGPSDDEKKSLPVSITQAHVRNSPRGTRVASGVDTGMMFINDIDCSDAALTFGGIKNSGYVANSATWAYSSLSTRNWFASSQRTDLNASCNMARGGRVDDHA